MPKARPIASVDDLTPDTLNANRHTQRGMAMMETSLRECGYGDSVTVDREGRVISGNGRVETLAAIGMTDAIVVQSDGTRPIIHQRTDLDLATDDRAKRLALLQNRTGQVNLEWDAQVLAELAEQGTAMDDLFAQDEMDALLGDLVNPQAGDGGDEFDTTPDDGPTRVQPGEVWRIGPHRIVCGDCTDSATVDRVMGGSKAAAVLTDPPYGTSQPGVPGDEPENLAHVVTGSVACLPVQDAVVVAFQSPRTFPVWLDAVRSAGHKFERMLWLYKQAQCVKPWRGWLLTSEAILVSSVGSGQWTDAHPYSHDCYLLAENSGGLSDDMGWHGSVKPLSIVQDILGRICPDNRTVYDPFLGSGTTLIAAHRLGRVCVGCEIEPRYCDVILRRAEAEGIGPIERDDG